MEHPAARETPRPQERAAQTRRARSRVALLNAARQVFEDRGWSGTRMEDVAATAQVSVATAYNHFTSKHILLAQVYAPLVRAELDVSRTRTARCPAIGPPLEAHVRDLADLVHSHEALTVALTHAMHEYGERAAGRPRADDPDDPRVLVPFASELHRLIELGQRSGEFRPFPGAEDLASLMQSNLLTAAILRPGGAADQTAEIALTVLFGALQPEFLLGAHHERPFADRASPFSATQDS